MHLRSLLVNKQWILQITEITFKYSSSQLYFTAYPYASIQYLIEVIFQLTAPDKLHGFTQKYIIRSRIASACMHLSKSPHQMVFHLRFELCG